MKALKIIIGIIVILSLIGGAYMVFFYHPGEVQEIMDNHKKEKAAFESKINGYKAREVELDKIIKDQEAEIVEAENKQKATETALEKLQKKYKKAPRPVDPETMKSLQECKGQYSVLVITLQESEILTAGTQKALDGCNQLRLFQAKQIVSYKLGMGIKREIIATQEIELNRRDTTIQALKKVSSKINLKKAAIYTGIVTGIVFVGTKLLQVIFGK